ncbi:MAG: hypothetical protein LZF61_06920 [Nitrosomonas sp.]|nr:MAG: hypothetical protein LZF61_06920 [Nitrosomonas sp.]
MKNNQNTGNSSDPSPENRYRCQAILWGGSVKLSAIPAAGRHPSQKTSLPLFGCMSNWSVVPVASIYRRKSDKFTLVTDLLGDF